MTAARQDMERTARRFARVTNLATVALFGTLLVWALGYLSKGPAEVITITAFFVLTGSFIALHAIGIRCPRCQSRLERYYRVAFLEFAGPDSCPRCGLPFDSAIQSGHL